MVNVSRRSAMRAAAGVGVAVAAAFGGAVTGEEPEAPKVWTLEGELKVHPKYLYRYYLVLGNGQMCALYGSDHGLEVAQLARLKPPTRVRVRGLLGTAHYLGGTKDNPSPFPETWTLYMDVNEVEAIK